MLKEYAEENDIVYVDYYSSLVNKVGGLPEKYSPDGVHPNIEGYKIMEKVISNELIKNGYQREYKLLVILYAKR